MLRLAIIVSFLAGSAQADIKTVKEAEAVTPACDTCLARQNGKRALRAYLAEKRAQEEADANKKQDD